MSRFGEHWERLCFGYAGLWTNWYRLQFRVKAFGIRNCTALIFSIAVVLCVAGLFFLSDLQAFVRHFFEVTSNLERLSTFYVSIGSALIGASAIAFSFVMFAMQVNVERLPHGLFRVFNSDARIVGAFVGTIILSVLVALFSLVSSVSYVAVSIYSSFCSILFIFLFFWYAYKRALLLINPTKQLAILTNRTARVFQIWVKRSKRAQPLFVEGDEIDWQGEFDTRRLAYFKLNPHWTNEGHVACSYAMAYAQRYVEMGDYDVSLNALIALVNLNQEYVNAKGKTFFSENILGNNPEVHDGFISDTLEHLRQYIRAGISRNDETQIEQGLKTLGALVGVYLTIPYAGNESTKTHANLAAGYLGNAVKDVLSHKMPDVSMEGVRILGNATRAFINAGCPDYVSLMSDRIVEVGLPCLVVKENQPVTEIAVDEFKEILLYLMLTYKRSTDMAIEKLTQSICLLTEMYLQLPAEPLAVLSGNCLGPYYSPTDINGFTVRFSKVVNAVLESPEGDENVHGVLRNIRSWSKILARVHRKVFKLSLEKKSSFNIEFVLWTKSVVEALLAASNAEACDEVLSDNIREDALNLVRVFTFIPDDIEIVRYIEGSQITENLFAIALEGWRRGCLVFSYSARLVFEDWVFKAGKYTNGWGILERGILGLCALVLFTEEQLSLDRFKQRVTQYAESIPVEIKDDAARALRRKAEEMGEPRGFDELEYWVNRSDKSLMRPLLYGIAQILSPGTVGEPIEVASFW